MVYPLILLAGLAAAGCQTGAPLFNGRNLAGWTEIGSTGAWTAEQGKILKCNGKTNKYAWLSTDRRYSDFVLDLDWRVSDKANSGIFLRVPDREGRSSMKGFEIQIRDDAVDEDLTDASGSVFRRVPAPAKYARPTGQWNHFRITVHDRHVRVELNGHVTVDTGFDNVQPRAKDPPMSAVPNQGYIGLQNHGTPVEYRNLRLRELE
ncbi:MAG: DUF1080 domain-containing protein [Phycisphaerae bacterium]|nr:DUF1080 domain-containing protein [Phycisphaerae bacterium]